MIRTTFLSTTTGATQRLMERSAAADRSAARLVSGRAFSRASEDPAAATTALALRGELGALKAYQATAEGAQTRLDVADTQLADVSSLVGRLKELTVAASTGTMNAEGRTATAHEVAQIRDQLVGLANAQHLGQPLFAGFGAGNAVAKTGAPAAWSFTGNANEKIMRSVSDSDNVQVNVTAVEVFQAGSSDAFTTLDQLVADLGSGNTAGLRSAVDAMDSFRSSVSTARARIGAATNRVENVLAGNKARQTTVQADLSKAEDVDLTEAITDANRQQAAYQAALGATAKSLQQSLVDFLR